MSAKIAAKMVLAMKDIDAVLKNGRNDFQKYNYVRAADVANEARAAMIAHGIAFTYDVVDSKHWESAKEGKSTNYFCELTVNVTFTDVDSGEQFGGKVVGWGSDTLDKAPFKAMTGAVKYALRMNFLIPDDSDPENDKPEPKQGKPEPAAAPAPKRISKTKRDAFIAAVQAKGISKDGAVFILNQHGFQSSGEVTEDKYDELMEAINAPKA